MKYELVRGLLRFSYEISEITDDVEMSLVVESAKESFETIQGKLSPSDFKELDWMPFPGTRIQLEKLMYGFFDEDDFLREEKNSNGEEQYVFLMETGESIFIQGQEGFEQLVKRVFNGDKERALDSVAFVLDYDHLRWLEWDEVEYRKWGTKPLSLELRELKFKLRELEKKGKNQKK